MFITLFGTRGGIALYLLSHYMGRPEQLSSFCVSYVITSTTRLIGNQNTVQSSRFRIIIPQSFERSSFTCGIVFYSHRLLQSSSRWLSRAIVFYSHHHHALDCSISFNTYPENLRSNSTLYHILLVFYEFSNYFITLHFCISVYVSKSDHRLSK